MLPILYPARTTNTEFFEHNGLGFIAHCLSCVVTETLNGSYELDMELLPNDRLAKILTTQCYIKVRPNPTGSMQIFEIYEVEKNRGKIRVKAEHIRYRMNGNAFSETWYIPESQPAMTPSQIWSEIQDFLAETSEFTFTSDITSKNRPNAAANQPIRLGDFMLGSTDSMLDTFGGDYTFDNFSFSLNQRRGADTGVCLRLGVGVSDATYKITSDKMYTHVLPYSRLQKIDPDGKVIGEQAVNYDPVATENTVLNSMRVLQYDFSQEMVTRYPDFKLTCDASGIPTNYHEARLKVKSLADKYISKNKAVLTQPSVTLDVKINAETDQLRTCGLGDQIRVFIESMNIYVESRIVKTEYDVLRERFQAVEVGNTPKSVSSYFSNINMGGK